MRAIAEDDLGARLEPVWNQSMSAEWNWQTEVRGQSPVAEPLGQVGVE